MPQHLEQGAFGACVENRTTWVATRASRNTYQSLTPHGAAQIANFQRITVGPAPLSDRARQNTKELRAFDAHLEAQTQSLSPCAPTKLADRGPPWSGGHALNRYDVVAPPEGETP